MKTKLYLDTSIPSAYYDYSKPVRQLITENWFKYEAINYDLYMSFIGIAEIKKISNPIRKDNIMRLIVDYNIEILDVDKRVTELSEVYMKRGAIPESEPEDAMHVAIATINGIHSLASWNFKHIVSINPIRKIHEINREFNYINIEIGSLEIFGGSKYGNI